MAEEKQEDAINTIVDLTESSKRTSSSVKGSKVKIFRKHPVNGKYVVITEGGDYYLVSTGDLEYSFHWQDIAPNKLSEKPYDWNSEIKEMNLQRSGKPADKKDVLAALYRGGHVAKDSTKGMNDSLWAGGIRQGRK